MSQRARHSHRSWPLVCLQPNNNELCSNAQDMMQCLHFEVCNIYVSLWMKGFLDIVFEVNLNMFSDFGLFDCFNSIIGSYDILIIIYLYVMGDV